MRYVCNALVCEKCTLFLFFFIADGENVSKEVIPMNGTIIMIMTIKIMQVKGPFHEPQPHPFFIFLP